jgi:hypothetical protein
MKKYFALHIYIYIRMLTLTNIGINEKKFSNFIVNCNP